MKQFFSIKQIHQLFILGLVLKILNVIAEITGGLFVLLSSKETLVKLIFFITQGELLEDPKDIIANYFISLPQSISLNTTHFIGIYLLSHGVIKLFLIISLLKNKLWSYLASIIVFGLFILYQIFRYFNTFSYWLLVITLFDLFVVWLVWKEYKNVKSNKLLRQDK